MHPPNLGGNVSFFLLDTYRLRLSVPLYGRHLRKWRYRIYGLKAKQAKAHRGIPRRGACALVSNLCYCESPSEVMHCWILCLYGF